MYHRRELVRMTLLGLAAPLVNAYPSARGNDVATGVQTRSFLHLHRRPDVDPVDDLVAAVSACQVHHCELFGPQIEPQFVMSHGQHGMSSMARQMMRRELRKWRLRTPASHFTAIAKKFAQANIAISAFNYCPDAGFTDEEIDASFLMAKALGAEIVTASTTLDMASRLVPFAERHRMTVALHGVGDFAVNGSGALPTALNVSRYLKVSLDVGDLTAANIDALAYLRDHHRDVANLRLKDRRRNHGENRPWGEGDTPIRDVLRLVKDEMWPIRGYVEYAYAGIATPVDEVKKCLAYASTI